METIWHKGKHFWQNAIMQLPYFKKYKKYKKPDKIVKKHKGEITSIKEENKIIKR